MMATYYLVDPLDPTNTAYKVFVYNKISYGDALAAALLEVVIRLWVSKDCTPLRSLP